MNFSSVYKHTVFWFIFLCAFRAYEVDTLTCRCTARRDCEPKKDICITDGVCYAVTLLSRNSAIPVTEYGCHDAKRLHPVGNPFVCHYNHQKSHLNTVACCKNEDFCNEKPDNIPTLAPAPQPVIKIVEADSYLVIAGACTITVLILAILAGLLWYAIHCKQSDNMMKKDLSDHRLLGSAGSTSTKIDIEHTETGSGSGLPTFIPRTIAREIDLDVIVGTGRYGEVWRGTWKGEHVAVKIFHSREERSWFREAEIYQTVMLRHENILGFIAADNKDNGTWTQLWLVTDYHPHGSLFDYLNSTAISMDTMLGMLFTISSGLSHLHMEIVGTQGKPGIAHRDLKSKNILVKKNLECCIADLGLAVKHFSERDVVDIAINSRVGTMRYMAPEIIEGHIDTSRFACFTQADIYSLSLVFWEIVRRCDEFGTPDEYQLPYFDCVPSDPTQEEMLKAIIIEKKRPRIYDRWMEHKTFLDLCQIMKQCWFYNPTERMESLRVKKSLMKIISNQHQFARELLPTSSQV